VVEVQNTPQKNLSKKLHIYLFPNFHYLLLVLLKRNFLNEIIIGHPPQNYYDKVFYFGRFDLTYISFRNVDNLINMGWYY
jgi:hypothetical protein